MPRYPHECPKCGHREEWIVVTMDHRNDPVMCEECGERMKRVYDQPPATLDRAYQKPIEMFSVAPENPTELAALRRKLPDTQFTDQGVPLARTRSEKLRILRATGYEEHN